MTIYVYIYGCNCGEVGKSIQKINNYAEANNIHVEVKNSQYSKQTATEHMQLLKDNGYSVSEYIPLVVQGDLAVKLGDWDNG